MDRATTALRALLAGGCIALALPPWGWWPLALVGFAVFARLLEVPGAGRRFRRGWLVGVAWLAPSTFWIVDMTAPGWVVASLVLGAYVGAAAALVPGRRPWTWVGLPAAVAIAELFRTAVPFGGIPLSTVAMTQAASPLGPVARLGGGVALTLVTVAGGVLLAAAAARHLRGAAIAAIAVVGLVGLAAVAPQGHDVGRLRVALVQGGGPQRTRAVDTDANLVFQRHLVASAQVQGPVDLVVWPENVVSVDGPFQGSDEEADLVALARRLGAPVVPGIVESFPGRFYNASVVLLPDGTTESRYDKVRRVPFGEYVPFRATIDALSGGSISRLVPTDAVAGTGPAVLDTPTGTAGIVISWEVFFERRARDAIANGGEILLNPTNGSSYWLTIVQSQQVASSRLRALETGRWVLQTAPTGFSAVVGPDGTVHQRTGVSESAVLQQEVSRRQGLTWSVRFGPWPALAVALALLAGSRLADRRRPTDPTDPAAATSEQGGEPASRTAANAPTG